MFAKILIGILFLGLVTTAGFYLKSEYSDTPSANLLDNHFSSKSSATQKPADTASAQIPEKESPATALQPGKSLPIPAHQLKKLISNNPQKDKAINERVEALNQRLEKIGQALPALAAGATSNKETAVADKQDQLDRISHIREHLQKASANMTTTSPQ